VGKGNRADVYLEVRERRGHIFLNETSACVNEQTDDTSTDIALCIFCGKHTFKKNRKLHKIKTSERLQNVKDAAEGQNDYKMSGLLSNATFIDKAVYHSGCITQALVSFKNICPLLSLTSR
jgi:hypothetical protein